MAAEVAHGYVGLADVAMPTDALVGGEDGTGLRLGIVCARFNFEIGERLLEGARTYAEKAGVSPGDVTVAFVPGAFELALAARALAVSGRVDALICLGAVIRGETSHYELVSGESASGCQRVQLDTGVPVAFGVLTTENRDQALARSGGALGNVGAQAVAVAIEMARLLCAIKEA